MIKIIKKGNPEPIIQIIRRFECKVCGCVFEASLESCVTYLNSGESDFLYDGIGFCGCPDCGALCVGTIIDIKKESINWNKRKTAPIWGGGD